MDFLDHQFGEIIEHISERIGLRAAPRRHVVKDGPLAGVEFNDVGHIAVDRLVVGDAGAGGIGDGDLPGTIEIEYAGDAEP